jgi:hypothetical protein
MFYIYANMLEMNNEISKYLTVNITPAAEAVCPAQKTAIEDHSEPVPFMLHSGNL